MTQPDKRASLMLMLDSAHKIATVLILGGIMWWAGVVADTQKSVIQLTEQVRFLTQITQEGKADRYTPSDSVRDFSLRDQRLSEVERQMRDFEKLRGRN